MSAPVSFGTPNVAGENVNPSPHSSRSRSQARSDTKAKSAIKREITSPPISDIGHERALSVPDDKGNVRDSLRARADLTRAMEHLGVSTAETCRYSLLSGGGDFMEKEELIKIKKLSRDSDRNQFNMSESDKSRKRLLKEPVKGVKRRLVYWLRDQTELVFIDIADGSSLSYVYLQKTNVITSTRMGIARYFASTDNIHTSKFVELMLVEQVDSSQSRSIRQIPFPFAPARKYITIYIGGDHRYFKGLPSNSLPATLTDTLSVSSVKDRHRKSKKRKQSTRKQKTSTSDARSHSSASAPSMFDGQSVYSSDSQSSIHSFESYDDKFASQALDRNKQFAYFHRPINYTTAQFAQQQQQQQQPSQLTMMSTNIAECPMDVPMGDEAMFQQIAALEFHSAHARPNTIAQSYPLNRQARPMNVTPPNPHPVYETAYNHSPNHTHPNAQTQQTQTIVDPQTRAHIEELERQRLEIAALQSQLENNGQQILQHQQFIEAQLRQYHVMAQSSSQPIPHTQPHSHQIQIPFQTNPQHLFQSYTSPPPQEPRVVSDDLSTIRENSFGMTMNLHSNMNSNMNTQLNIDIDSNMNNMNPNTGVLTGLEEDMGDYDGYGYGTGLDALPMVTDGSFVRTTPQNATLIGEQSSIYWDGDTKMYD